MPSKKKPVKVIQDPMTHIVEVKKPYANEELLDFSRIMADSIAVIQEKKAELKEFSDEIKAEVERQEDALYSCAAKVKQGYEMMSVPCSVSYDGKTATFVSKETGEVVEKRELNEEEQMILTSQVHDAEEIIRADSEKNG